MSVAYIWCHYSSRVRYRRTKKKYLARELGTSVVFSFDYFRGSGRGITRITQLSGMDTVGGSLVSDRGEGLPSVCSVV